MEVKLGVGIDTIRFGMSELEVIAILGEPSLSKVDETDAHQNTVYQYDQLKLSLTFYSDENFRLAYLRTTNPAVSFQGKKLIDQPLSEVIEHFSNKQEDWQMDQYFSFSSHYYERKWLVLDEEYGRITNVELGAFRAEGSFEIMWPE